MGANCNRANYSQNASKDEAYIQCSFEGTFFCQGHDANYFIIGNKYPSKLPQILGKGCGRLDIRDTLLPEYQKGRTLLP